MNEEDDYIARPGMLSKPEKHLILAQFSNSPWTGSRVAALLSALWGAALLCRRGATIINTLHALTSFALSPCISATSRLFTSPCESATGSARRRL
jgi:hypothetical protein